LLSGPQQQIFWATSLLFPYAGVLNICPQTKPKETPFTGNMRKWHVVPRSRGRLITYDTLNRRVDHHEIPCNSIDLQVVSWRWERV
jgi:hypothetical protein